jgi:hypothetical protein
LLEGFAYCNLSKWADAEKAYAGGLAIDLNYAILYALCAEARQRQGNLFGALGDVQAMQKIKGSEELKALINASLAPQSSIGTPPPQLSCQNFFAPASAMPGG